MPRLVGAKKAENASDHFDSDDEDEYESEDDESQYDVMESEDDEETSDSDDETTFSKIGGGAIVSRNNADGWNRVNSSIVTEIKLDPKPPTVEKNCLPSPLRVP
jgi:hypothetical protein